MTRLAPIPLTTATTMLIALSFSAVVAGCAKPWRPVFPRVADAPVWPSPPEPARVRYVGTLATSADLKATPGLGERLGSAVFGKKPARSMLTPYAVCTDRTGGRVFVADSNAQCVHVFDLILRRYARWRPPRAHGRLAQPVGIAYDPAGRRVYVADSVGARVVVFDDGGRFRGEIGRGQLKRPAGLAFDVPRKRLLVADVAAHQVVALSPAGRVLARAGGRGEGLGEFNFPTNVALDAAGRVYVSDSLNFRVQQFDANLTPVRAIGRQGDMPGYFAQPKGLATDGDGHVYVVDAQFEAVQIFDADGSLLLAFGEEGRGPGQFWLPSGIAIDGRNRIWVADGYNRRIQVFDYVRGPAATPATQPTAAAATAATAVAVQPREATR